MNGFFFFSIILYLFHWHLGGLTRPLLSLDFWTKAEKALKRRDYLLRTLDGERAVELRLKSFLMEELRRGQLKLSEIEYLNRAYSESLKGDDEVRALLNSYTTHIGFVLLVPLLFRLLLQGKMLFGPEEAFPLLFSFGALLLLVFGLTKLWPRSVFASEERLVDFVSAYLGRSDTGIWEEDLARIKKESWATGIDAGAERRALLEAWCLSEASAALLKRKFLENCLGPLELVMTVVFGGAFLAGPLLSHFSSLVPA